MNICILSHSRSGSNWICSVFDPKYIYCAYEIYNPVSLIEKTLKELEKTPDIELTISHQVLSNLLNIMVDYDKEKLKNQTSNIYLNKIIDINIFKKISSINYKNGKHFLYKIQYHQYENNKKLIDDTIKDTDYIIKLYRNNILETFISLEKSKYTYCWTSMDKKINKNNYKFIWNEKKYIDFYNYSVRMIDWIINSYKDKKFMCLMYEEIHINDENDKILYLEKQIHKNFGIKLHIKNQNLFYKENKTTNYSNNFHNPEDFIKSIYNNIPIYYKSII